MEILLNPGPVNLSERVRKALLKPDLCHREAEFSQLQNRIREKLLRIYDLPATGWAAVVLTGSGTSAMEAMVTSLVPQQGKLLILENGVYGERLTRIAEIYGINHVSLRHEWGEEIKIGKGWAQFKDITHLALVHHETTSGRLNDIRPIAEYCAANNISLLLDAVSSFGAEEIDFANWPIAGCAATANKCLHGVPGTSFVIVRREALLEGKVSQRSLYLDLPTYLTHQERGGTPFTQSVQTFYALDEALDEHAEAGSWQARRACFRGRMETVRNGLLNLGVKPLLEEGGSSCVLNAFHLPDGIDYQTLHDGLKARGFIIYAGQGEFAKTLFRISVMGALTDGDIERLLAAVEEILS